MCRFYIDRRLLLEMNRIRRFSSTREAILRKDPSAMSSVTSVLCILKNAPLRECQWECPSRQGILVLPDSFSPFRYWFVSYRRQENMVPRVGT